MHLLDQSTTDSRSVTQLSVALTTQYCSTVCRQADSGERTMEAELATARNINGSCAEADGGAAASRQQAEWGRREVEVRRGEVR